MNSHCLLRSGFALLAALPALMAGVGRAADRPNIVFLYADDQRWDALGVVQREQGDRARFPWLKTPNLDRLAAESVRFRNAFVVNSLCSPGRACVLTGRYSHLNGIINNGTPLPLDATTFASELRKAGYATAYFGKWHMDGQTERPGFDEYASFIGQGRYFDCPLNVNGTTTQTTGWVDDVTTTRAIEFLKKQSGQKPFLLWLGFKSPHGPRGGENLPERLRNLYANEQSRPVPNVSTPAIYLGDAASRQAARQNMEPKRNEASTVSGHLDYFRHITGVDENVGRMREALRQSGLADNTIVVFTSDNGYYLGEHGLGDKRSAYDESLRVPYLVRWPGQGQAGVNDAMVLNIDFAPTLLDAAGVAVPAALQGRSLRPLLTGASPTGWRRSFLYEYFAERAFRAPTVVATRTSDAKLITYLGHEEWSELFDLKADSYETRNLFHDPASATLRQRLEIEHARLLAEVLFRMPTNVAADPMTATEPAPKQPRKGKARKQP